MNKKLLILAAVNLFITNSFAQQTTSSEKNEPLSSKEVAKQIANPVSNLIGLPIKNNVDFGIGKMNGTRNTTNIQPILPFKLSDELYLITRVVLPIVTQYNITYPEARQSGLSDTEISAFFAPISKNKGGFMWGAGPIISTPTGTNEFLTTKKWGAGPAIVGLVQTDGWTIGTMVNQVWSFAGDRNRDNINQMFVEPFVSYNWNSGAGVTVIGEYTQDWQHNRSTMTLQGSISGITEIGSQRVQLGIGPRFTLFGPSEMRSNFGITGGITIPFMK